ncbi:major facilitator superfamily domain-containing protein [Phaeosphaeriaceae sp. PMI808]|nr:major facilitator superfamily domain-containing protein [Phaeosphaeriaceae sp. PMI808]
MQNEKIDRKPSEVAVERFEDLSDSEAQSKHAPTPAAMGTVTITDMNEIYLIPAPSADPRDPLNMSKLRKIICIVLLSIFSCIGLALVSGFGALLPFYIPTYAAKGATYADITALMTYPSMFMGVGCLLARMLLGFATGQSEALVPMMIQEIHFMHERSTFLMWQSATQTVLSTAMILTASPIAGAIGPGNWYVFGAGLAGLTLILSIFSVPETRYNRPLVAYGQFSEEEGGEGGDSRSTASPPVKLSERPALDTTRYLPRTMWSDMRLFVGETDWVEGWHGFLNTFQILLFPNVMWAFCLNGLTIGIQIAIGTTYGNILTHAPYKWSESSVSYVNAGQVVVAFIALPLLGNGSDYVIKWRARRNGGVHEPENRLLLLWVPLLVGIVSIVLYGQAAQFPEKYHWFTFVFGLTGSYFSFVGANITGMTYLLDAYPARAGPVLVVITAFRGFVSFGTSYGVAKFIETSGYDGSFGTYAGLTALFGLLGIPVFIFGKRIRMFTGRWTTKTRSGKASMSH